MGRAVVIPDYNLGRAHGTIRVDYDGSGVTRADDDLSKLGDTTDETGRKISESTEQSSKDYDQLAAAARRLEQVVTRAAAAEISARARVAAAEEHLRDVHRNSASSVQDLVEAQRQLTSETKKYEASVLGAQNASRALEIVRRQLAGHRPSDITPVVNVSKMADVIHHLQNIDKSTRKSVFGLNAFTGRMRAMIGLVAVASPAIAGLGVSLVSLSGLVGVAAGTLAGLIAVAGTLVTAFKGIGAVFKAAGQQAASAGSNAAQAASQQRAAARQIEQAIRGVRDAEEDLQQVRRDAARAAVQAAQQIIQAERQLRDAQFDAIRAQESLTRARRDAARQIEDLRSQLIGGALDERQAIIDVKRAQEELNRTLADPRSSSLDREQAILSLERQQQALENVGTQNRRLAEDQTETAARGIQGSDQVVNAQRDVLHAQEAVGEAAIGVAEAVVSAADQQIQGQRSIRDATESLSDAQVDLAEAYLQASEAAASAGAKMSDALANVSPEARKLTTAIIAQGKAWKEVKFAVQDALFAGLSDEVAPLAGKWFPLLKTGMTGIATELRGIIVDLIDFLHQGRTTSDVATIFENVRQAVRAIAPAIRALLSVFLDLATVGSGFLPGMAKAFADWAKNLAEVTKRSRETGEMQQWIRRALDTLGKLWDLLGNVASIIGTIFSAFDQEGGDALTTLVNLTDRLDKFLKSAQGQDILHALGKTLAALASLIGDVLIGAFVAFGPVFVKLAPLIQQFADVLGKEILVAFLLLAPVLKIVADILVFLGPVLVPLIASMFLLNKVVGLVAIGFRVLTAVMALNPFVAIAAAVIALAILVITNWDKIKNFLIEAWTLIRDGAVHFWEQIKSAIVDPVVKAVQAVIGLITGLITGAKQKWSELLEVTRRAIDHVRSAIVEPIRKAIDAVLDFFDRLQGWIGDKLRDIGSWLFDKGRQLIQGLIDGVERMLSVLWDKIESIGRGVGNAFSSVLSIFSPSRVFEEFGEFTMKGYIVGLDSVEPQVLSRVAEIAARVVMVSNPDNLVPAAAAVPATRGTTATAEPAVTGQRLTSIQNLNLTVTGNLDPTDRIRWRKAIKQIKKDIEDVDRSEEP